MLDKLKADKESLETEITELSKKRDNSTGQAKAKLTQKIKALKSSVSTAQDKIAEFLKAPEETPKLDTEMKVVVNLSNYTKVDPIELTRFNPNLETPAKMSGWVQSQVEAGLFKIIDK
jgi:seryl-tRNA synthetase